MYAGDFRMAFLTAPAADKTGRLDISGRGWQSGFSMLSWFRAHARAIAAAALLSLVTLSVWSAAPHQDDCHDAVCVSLVVPHDPSAHSIGRGASTTDRPLHCVLCHWTRTVRPSSSAAHPLAPAVARDVRFLVDVFSAPEANLAAQPPLRAPPSSPAPDA
jgi:hypothetical protein